MKHRIELAFASMAMLLAVACTSNASLTEHVILIGLDGMSSADFDRNELPVISSVMDEGCWTLEKRSVFKTSSAVNWASMFMGAGTELTGYTTWGSKMPELPSRVLNEHNIFPTINSILREQRPESEIGAVYEWETIQWLIDSLAVNYFEHADESVSTDITDKAISYIKEKKPTLFTIVYDHPDAEGHGHGWGTEEYHQGVRFLDGEVGRILQAVKDAGIWEKTTIIITSDHGGKDTNHGGIDPSEYNTPFIIAGKGIRKGGEFSESMMQYDVAATIAAMFKLGQPQVWVGRPMTQCFE